MKNMIIPMNVEVVVQTVNVSKELYVIQESTEDLVCLIAPFVLPE